MSINDHRLYYLASPYSHEDPGIVEERYEKAMQAAAGLLANGINVFSPIVHSHNIAVNYWGTLKGDWETWKRLDLLMLSKSDAMIVLRIPGWATSKGIAAEIEYAENNHIPLIFWNPEETTPGEMAAILKEMK